MGPSGPQAGRIWRQCWQWSTSSFAESVQFGGTSLHIMLPVSFIFPTRSLSILLDHFRLYSGISLSLAFGHVRFDSKEATGVTSVRPVFPLLLPFISFQLCFSCLSDYSSSCRSIQLSTEANQPANSSLRWFMRCCSEFIKTLWRKSSSFLNMDMQLSSNPERTGHTEIVGCLPIH